MHVANVLEVTGKFKDQKPYYPGGWIFGAVLEVHVIGCDLSFSPLGFQLPASGHSGKWQAMALEFLPSMSETWAEAQLPDFGLEMPTAVAH